MRKIYYRKRQEDLENRIILTTPSYFAGLRVLYISLFLMVAAVITALLYLIGISVVTLAISGGILGLMLLFLASIKKQSWVVSIKDDAIIHTRSDDRSFVTSVKSVGNLKSFRIVSFVVTRYTWNLDGMYKRSLIISKWEGRDNTPKEIIKEVLRKYKKKANHKPGSVIAV